MFVNDGELAMLLREKCRLYEALTEVQTKCSEQLLELRQLRAQIREMEHGEKTEQDG